MTKVAILNALSNLARMPNLEPYQKTDFRLSLLGSDLILLSSYPAWQIFELSPL